MIGTILLDARAGPGFETRFQAALALAGRFEAHLICLQVTAIDMIFSGGPLEEGNISPVSESEVREHEKAHREAATLRLIEASISWEWMHRDGLPAQILLDHSALADLIILSGPEEGGRVVDANIGLTTKLAVIGGPPLLYIPCNAKLPRWSGTALVAWNGSVEAAHALRQAVPFLKKATMPLLENAAAVHILTIGEEPHDHSPEEARLYLARHGIESVLHHQRAGEGVASTILENAAVLNAQYLVLGAYSHSKFHEALLGGVTRDLLRTSHLPLFLGR